MEVETNQDNIISDVDVIDSPVEVIVVGDEGLEEGENREKREKHEKELEIQNQSQKQMLEVTTQILEILLKINTSTCDEVIFKKHVVDIIDKDTRCCIMNDVVVDRYQLEGRPWDPDIVLIFEDGRRFCNDNFKYMFRYYIGAV
jgi:hypothetical protein